MLTYRIARGSERKVFKVDVGNNMDPKDVGPIWKHNAMMFKHNKLTQQQDKLITI